MGREITTYDLKAHDGAVGDGDVAEEVVPILVGGERDTRVRKEGTLEVAETLELNSLLEGNVVVPVEALDLDSGVTEDCDTDGVAHQEPGVEASESNQIVDGGELSQVNLLELVSGRLGELQPREGSHGLEVLQVHDALKGLNGGGRGATEADGAVHRHGEVVCFRVASNDGLDAQLGAVELVLGNLGHANEDAKTCVSHMCSVSSRVPPDID